MFKGTNNSPAVLLSLAPLYCLFLAVAGLRGAKTIFLTKCYRRSTRNTGQTMRKMKIAAINAPKFCRHLENLSRLGGLAAPYPFDLYSKLKRLENRANRICTEDCNGDISSEWADVLLSRIEAKVKDLLPLAKTVFINRDPRGYSLKLKEDEASAIGIYQDWGGYGILAPEF